MKSIFKRHRVRSTFYHVVTASSVVLAIIGFAGFIPMNVAFAISLFLIFADWVAEMYDPHPEAPGPGFKRHFHRIIDDDNEAE